MSLDTLLGIIGVVLSVVALFIPDRWRSKRAVFMSFLVSITFVGGMAVYYKTQYYRLKKIAVSAERLTAAKRDKFTDEGYVQAGLTFLEQNKDVYPDAYERGKQLQQRLLKDNDGYKNISYASEMDGILKGMQLVNGED